jgi:hypothetical protein
MDEDGLAVFIGIEAVPAQISADPGALDIIPWRGPTTARPGSALVCMRAIG